MAVAYTATVNGYDYGFDFEDQRIDIDDGIDRLSVVDLYDAIKLAQADEAGIAYPEIATASGLDQLSSDILTYITVKLLSNWEINTLKVTGKFEVSGGNLIRADNADPFRDNPLITYINYISQAGVVAAVSTGSGLSTEEHNKLMATATATSVAEVKAEVEVVAAVADGDAEWVDDGDYDKVTFTRGSVTTTQRVHKTSSDREKV